MEASLHFYQEIIGASFEREVPEIGLKQLRAGRSLIDLVPQTGDVGGHNMEHFAISIEPFDADQIAAFLLSKNITSGPVERRYGADGYGPSIYIHDPDNNVVELKGPAEH